MPPVALNKVIVKAHSRIHIGLLSLHAGAPRVNGGVGFAVEHPNAEITAYRCSQVAVVDERLQPMGAEELGQLSQILTEFSARRALAINARVVLRGAMRTHVGLGSATAVRLGALEALSVLNQISISPSELISESGRGGTSGIGVNSYFTGGLICDLGQASDGSSFAPSSQVSRPRRALSLPSVMMPNWPLIICVPRFIEPKTQAEEVDFFKRITPISAEASYEASYVALFQIYAAAAEGNYAGFCAGVNQMQRTVWKSAERAEYGTPLRDLATELQQAGADCVGMSSLGGVDGLAHVLWGGFP